MPWGIRVIWLYGRVLCWPNRFRKPKNIKRMYKQGRWRACCLLKARSLIFGLLLCVQVFFSFTVLLWSRMCCFWCECMVFAHECTVLIRIIMHNTSCNIPLLWNSNKFKLTRFRIFHFIKVVCSKEPTHLKTQTYLPSIHSAPAAFHLESTSHS